MNRFGLLLRVLLVVYNFALVYFTLAPRPEIERIPAVGRLVVDVAAIRGGAVVHFFMILVLVVLWFLNGRSQASSLWVSLFTGAVLEGIQYFIPWRLLSVQDFLSNFAGGAAGYALLAAISRNRLFAKISRRIEF